MKKIVVLFIILHFLLLYGADYNLDKDFHIINKYDNISTSDDITFTFYIEFKYNFTGKGKKTYRKMIKGLEKDIDKLRREKIKNEIDKAENDACLQMAENLFGVIYPPENFMIFSVDYALNEVMKNYDSNTVEDYLKSKNTAFYKTLEEKIKKSIKENKIGNIISIKFLNPSEYKEKISK